MVETLAPAWISLALVPSSGQRGHGGTVESQHLGEWRQEDRTLRSFYMTK